MDRINAARKQTVPESGNSAGIPRGAVRYEAVFLDNDEVDAMLRSIRGDAPYPRHSSNFHITTVFSPEQDAGALYGKEAEARFIGYKACEVTDEKGNTSCNEGLKVLLSSDDTALAEYLGVVDKNFHLTGSYTTASKYTEYIDFSDMKPIDYTLRGVFGAFLEGTGVVLDATDAGRPPEGKSGSSCDANPNL
jgi:hypothetical protein